MKKYTEFVNSRLNEEKEFGSNDGAKKLGGLLKNMLGGLMKGISDEFKKPFEDFNKKLANTKDKEAQIKIVTNYFITHKEQLDSSLQDTTTPSGLVEDIENNLRTAYSSIKVTASNLKSDLYTFDSLFSESGNNTKKIMTKDEKLFNKTVEQFSKDLVLNIGKDYGVTKEDLDKEPEEAKSQQEQEQTQEAAPEEGTETPAETPAKGEVVQAGHLHSDYKDKLYEAVSTDDMVKLKAKVVEWFDNTLYKKVKLKLEEVRKEKPKKDGDDLNKTIENIPNDVTQNKDSVKAMVNKLATTDKQTMIKVRDILGLNKNDTPL